jgi:hypothetical protein
MLGMGSFEERRDWREKRDGPQSLVEASRAFHACRATRSHVSLVPLVIPCDDEYRMTLDGFQDGR